MSESIALALQHYQAGQFDQAELLCQQLLQQQPDEVAALHLAGLSNEWRSVRRIC